MSEIETIVINQSQNVLDATEIESFSVMALTQSMINIRVTGPHLYRFGATSGQIFARWSETRPPRYTNEPAR